MMAKVGEVTTSLTPSSSQIALINVVLPAPMLPAPNLSTSYVFATGDSFFAYPNNYNYYVSYFRDTFQHGGISMEEMIIPLITLTGKKR